MEIYLYDKEGREEYLQKFLNNKKVLELYYLPSGDYSKKNFLSNNQKITLDSLAYSLLPKHYKISDKRKEKITIRHLLTMTSGIPGEASGVYGIPTTIDFHLQLLDLQLLVIWLNILLVF